MVGFCGHALFAAAVFLLELGPVFGGIGKSLRGARVEMDLRFDALSEIDMPSIEEIDEGTINFDRRPEETDDQMSGIRDSAEMADSDENEDVQGFETDEGVKIDIDAIEHLTRISNFVDTNNDGVLSPQELEVFADGLHSKKKWEHTRSTLVVLDADNDGQVTHAEIENRVSTSTKSNNTQRFVAADRNGDGLLNESEFHSFVYPAAHHMVLKVESGHQFAKFDIDGNNRISFEEFTGDDEHHEDFSHEAAKEDYYLHDFDGSGDLDADEFERLLGGRDLLQESINKAISAVDSNGDGHISISEELPSGLQGLLDSEYIEDFFFHEYAGRHDEL